MTMNKRYFSVDYGEEYYIFDSTKISKEEVLEKAEYSYDIFSEALIGDDVVNLLNKNEQLKQQINDVRLDWSQDYRDFNKDTLYVEDHNDIKLIFG